MASGWTNKLKWRLLGWVFVNQTEPTVFYCALVTNAVTPTVDTNTKSELTEIANGNGYTTGGFSLTPGATDFDVHTEDDTNDWGLVQCKDIAWTATGGPIPISGTGAYHSIITDDNVTQGSREVYAFHDLSGPISVSVGQTLTLQNVELRIT